MEIVVEICCGSYYDALMAKQGGASRIELNSALYLGGLTPSLATLLQVKKDTDLTVICMLRNRGGGFCLKEEDYLILKEDCRLMLEHGADGIAFGFLTEDQTIDLIKTKEIVTMIHSYHKTAVFHRAFDCVKDPILAINQLIEIGVDRVLSSGGKKTAIQGANLLSQLQQQYGNQIEILVGSGVNETNVKHLLDQTGVKQVHSSCKGWLHDPTSVSSSVSFGFDSTHPSDYDVVDSHKVKKLIQRVKEY